MSWPEDPIAAVTHTHPYPYYASLVAENPLFFDSRLNMWVASDAKTVHTVMAHDLCRVRPIDERIPRSLQNTSAESIFRHLVRMTDGEEHQPTKLAIATVLAAQSAVSIAPHARRLALSLWQKHETKGFRYALTHFQFDFSVYVIGHMLGFSDEELPALARWIKDFVPCLSPLSNPEQIHGGIIAAERLLTFFTAQLDRNPNMGLLFQMKQAIEATGLDARSRIVANGIGFLLGL
jgi:cytochrome P450